MMNLNGVLQLQMSVRSVFLSSLDLDSIILSRMRQLLSKHPDVAIKSRSDPLVIPVIVSFFLQEITFNHNYNSI